MSEAGHRSHRGPDERDAAGPAAEWLAGHRVKPSTCASYALLVDKFILPALGDQTLPAPAKLAPLPYERLSEYRDQVMARCVELARPRRSRTTRTRAVSETRR